MGARGFGVIDHGTHSRVPNRSGVAWARTLLQGLAGAAVEGVGGEGGRGERRMEWNGGGLPCSRSPFPGPPLFFYVRLFLV